MMEKVDYIAESLLSLVMPIDELHLDPANARTGHDIEKIAASLAQYGQRKPLVVNRQQNMKIEAGNGTWQAAKKLGWTYIAAVIVDDDPTTAAAFGIADNRTAELSKWDPDALEDILETTGDLFTGFEAASIGDVADAGQEKGEEPDENGDEIELADQLQAKWQTAPGQLWILGEHRVLCGDSTQSEDVDQLMQGKTARMCFTDPPWNVAIGTDELQEYRQRKPMENDNLKPDEFAQFLAAVGEMLHDHVSGDVYCVMGGSEWPTLDAGLRKAGLHWSASIIWVKDQFVMGHGKYHRRYEPIWYGWNGKNPSSFEGGRDQDDVWEYPRPKKSPEHPTMKPVALVERAVRNSSQVGDLVLDLFGGSGTTLMACHRTQRVARVIEKDPRYVAVHLERWAKVTGSKPVLLEMVTGEICHEAGNRNQRR
jgi:DNA modification methylase